MAVKGSAEKEIIFQKLTEVFPEAFMDGKIMRVPFEGVEIKVTLTAAKDIIGGGGTVSASTATASAKTVAPEFIAEPTQDEKEKVQDLLSKLGF